MGTGRDLFTNPGHYVSDLGKNTKGSMFGSPGKTSFQEVPGVITRERGGEFAELAGQAAGQSVNPNLQALLEQNLMNRPGSPYQASLQSRLNTPQGSPYDARLQESLLGPAQFGGRSEAENNLINQAYSGRQAQFNNLGIGASPLAQSAIAAAAAPTLAGLRQQEIGNLFQGQGAYNQNYQNQTQNLLTGQGQFDTQQNAFMQNLLNSLQQGLAARGQTIQGYGNLAQLGQPQLGQTGKGPTPGMFSQIDPNKAFDQGMAAFGAA